ncbi:MAG TPA: peptidoglycan-associated lipoprotein Pal [Thermoanaerobaculia bacterium]|jgi:peptidoglycan-associated lipoprotein|nr:peptidoglycan-associated lipoprotein Pal [Thermoanaerobaculia bacterium]
MNRKWMIWTVIPVLLTFLYGCPKKKPATPPADLDVETTTVPAPPSSTTTQPQEVEQPAAPEVNDTTEDPLTSSNMDVINQELQRRGFSADIYFDYDESTLSDDTRDKLSRNADLLKGNPQFSVTIEGHADSRGTSEYNLALGERRANAVKDYLTSLGVGGDRLRTLSYGEERPACNTDEESCWSQNRRAHMVITGRSNVG